MQNGNRVKYCVRTVSFVSKVDRASKIEMHCLQPRKAPTLSVMKYLSTPAGLLFHMSIVKINPASYITE